MHDWSDGYCITILKHLRAAAGPKTQLMIVELAMPSVSEEPAAREIPGAELPAPPQPLLRSHRSTQVYLFDIMVRNQKWNSNCDDNMGYFFAPTHADKKMMSLLNGQERTITQFGDLLNQAGWKLAAVHHDSLSVRRFHKVIAIPA
jgi:hypothetical protein